MNNEQRQFTEDGDMFDNNTELVMEENETRQQNIDPEENGMQEQGMDQGHDHSEYRDELHSCNEDSNNEGDEHRVCIF